MYLTTQCVRESVVLHAKVIDGSPEKKIQNVYIHTPAVFREILKSYFRVVVMKLWHTASKTKYARNNI